MADNLSAFFDDDGAAVASETNTPESSGAADTPQEPPPEGQTGDKEADAPPAPQPASQPAEAAPQTVPLAAFLAVRDELRDVKAMLRERAPPTPPNEPPPNFAEEPEEYVERRVQEIAAPLQQEVLRTKFVTSQRQAVADFGAETVAEAAGWFRETYPANHPAAIAMAQSDDPVRFVVETHRKARVLQAAAEHGYDLDAFARARAAQLSPPPPPPAPPATKPAAPPPSVNRMPSGGTQATAAMPTEDEDFADMFGAGRFKARRK